MGESEPAGWDGEAERRVHPRDNLAIDAVVRWDETKAAEVVVVSLSLGGAAFTSPELFHTGKRVELLFWDGAAVPAMVVGFDGFRTCCEFDEEIAPEYLEALAGQSPS
jgi:hypothetical protein